MRSKVVLGLIYAALTAGCASVTNDSKVTELEKEVTNMDFRLLNLQYEFQVQKCFDQYDFCVLKREDDCWKKHEKCVIEKTKFYKHLLKVRGFEK